jgi:hypothetical protein
MAVFSTSQNENPKLIRAKFVELITSVRSSNRPKYIIIGGGIAAPHMSEIFDWRGFSFSGV